MYANNEIGTIQPIARIGEISRTNGIPFHTDAVQAAGVLPLKVNDLNVDLLSLSAHKFYGPKGVGTLYVRKGTPMEFQQNGGGQEAGRRGGTENVPLIVGMAQALVNADTSRDAYNAFCEDLRDALWDGIRERIPDVRLNGPEPGSSRLPNSLNVTIDGVQGETVLLSLDMQGVAASAGSACTTGNSEPSHVLLACGLTELDARSSLRLTVGRGNSMAEIEQAVSVLQDTVERVRTLAGSLP
jgi:cysteine desulfurase